MQSESTLPQIIAGPMLRRVSCDEVVVWVVTSVATALHWQIYTADDAERPHADGCFDAAHSACMVLGQHAFLHLLRLRPEQPLPLDCWLGYDLGLPASGGVRWLAQTVPSLCYAGKCRPEFVIKSAVDQILHGSCRKPHFDGDDGLLCVDQLLASAQRSGAEAQPAMLLCTGDQVYADDVAGPLLSAIVHVVRKLGLYREVLPLADGMPAIDSQSLLDDPHYYHRSALLPSRGAAGDVRDILFSGARKPIFTSVNAENHLLTLGEVLALYLLVWSPALWQGLVIDQPPPGLTRRQRDNYHRQVVLIERFKNGLTAARRVFANLPTYMIFDDHDITDDWNLSRAWEQSAYNDPLARRIIGNALIGYFLCQGWGNAPDNFNSNLTEPLQQMLAGTAARQHDKLIGRLLKFEGWQYVIDCSPGVVVLDTRTQRWHSEVSASWPSGLMDWESLADAQQQLIERDAVIVVSPAPIFGVKLIEVVQRVMTWCKLSLMVDAENWMAHPGSGSAILNIFQHRRTPRHFVILSGDVHYAFASDILLRHVKDSPQIWQITSSGLCNGFPPRLLRGFDRINRWLFASRSPLNWLTRRRRMKIRQRRPGNYSARYPHQRLVNGCGVGRVTLDDSGRPSRIEHVLSSGEAVAFVPGYHSDWVH